MERLLTENRYLSILQGQLLLTFSHSSIFMFIIWRGYGFLIPIITIVTGALITMLIHLVFKSNQPWGLAIGSFVSAAIIWFQGKKLNDPAKNRIMVDKATGQELILKPNHSLFLIKMQYWAFLVAALGLVTLISLIVQP